MKFLKQQLESTNKQIEELQNLEIEEYSVWKPEVNEYYWLYSSYAEVYEEKWKCCNVDNNRLSIGNVFRTKAEAEFQIERLRVLAQLKQFSKKFENYKDNFCIRYDIGYKELVIYNSYHYATCELCFASEKDAKDAIEFVGEDRVVKYYLEIEE